MNESHRVAISRQRKRDRDRACRAKWTKKDEGMTEKWAGWTVSLKPNGRNGAWDEFRSGTERTKGTEPRSLTPPNSTRVSFFLLPSLLYSSLSPRFVAPIINISPSSCLTARSSSLFLLLHGPLLLLLLLSRASLPPAHPAAYIVPIINSNLCRTLFFILPSSYRLRISIWRWCLDGFMRITRLCKWKFFNLQWALNSCLHIKIRSKQ